MLSAIVHAVDILMCWERNAVRRQRRTTWRRHCGEKPLSKGQARTHSLVFCRRLTSRRQLHSIAPLGSEPYVDSALDGASRGRGRAAEPRSKTPRQCVDTQPDDQQQVGLTLRQTAHRRRRLARGPANLPVPAHSSNSFPSASRMQVPRPAGPKVGRRCGGGHGRAMDGRPAGQPAARRVGGAARL